MVEMPKGNAYCVRNVGFMSDIIKIKGFTILQFHIHVIANSHTSCFRADTYQN